MIDATYFGSRGVHLPIPSLELNQIDPRYLQQGCAFLTELVPNPYFGQIRTGLLAQQGIPRMQLLKPFPQFANPATANAFGGSLNYLRPPVGDSVYHAATFRFERRFTKGLSFTAHYTISKLLDNTRLERSVGSFDIPQRIDEPAGGRLEHFQLPHGGSGLASEHWRSGSVAVGGRFSVARFGGGWRGSAVSAGAVDRQRAAVG